jgi:F-type H+-transporting ATPase subunit epsilon
MSFKLEIVTAERVLFDGEVETVIAPGREGELGVLQQHAALMTTLQPGELRYRTTGGESCLVVSGGFMEIQGDRVVVLADAAEHIDEIDEARAEEAIRRARERIDGQSQELDLERALRAIRRSETRIRVSRRRRSRLGTPPVAQNGGI